MNEPVAGGELGAGDIPLCQSVCLCLSVSV